MSQIFEPQKFGLLYTLRKEAEFNDLTMFILFLDVIRHLFTQIRYSDKGTSERVREETAFMYFIDYLDDCERSRLL